MFIVLTFILHVGAQNIEVIGDTIEIKLDGYKAGEIQWQFSTDNKNWNDIPNENSIAIKQKAIKTGFYRTIISSSNCTYFSETSSVFVILNKDDKIIFLKDIFVNKESGYECFRIPTILKSLNNRLLAFAEGRKNSCDDSGDTDIVLKYSDNEGITWSQLITIWNDGNNTCSNPSPVFDEVNNVIWLVACWNSNLDNETRFLNGTNIYQRKIFTISSKDNGLTWELPKDITSNVKTDQMNWYGTGPCHGIQIKSNIHKNRLIVPCNHSIFSTFFSHTIFSDDLGNTWKLGGIVPTTGQNESTIAELDNGKLILSMRNYKEPRTLRTISFSYDLNESWSTAVPNKNLIEPICQGSLLSITNDNKIRLLFSNPANQNERKNLTIKTSNDLGITWNKYYEITKNYSAYSDLVEISKKMVGIIFENGLQNPYEKISFSIISLE